MSGGASSAACGDVACGAPRHHSPGGGSSPESSSRNGPRATPRPRLRQSEAASEAGCPGGALEPWFGRLRERGRLSDYRRGAAQRARHDRARLQLRSRPRVGFAERSPARIQRLEEDLPGPVVGWCYVWSFCRRHESISSLAEDRICWTATLKPSWMLVCTSVPREAVVRFPHECIGACDADREQGRSRRGVLRRPCRLRTPATQPGWRGPACVHAVLCWSGAFGEGRRGRCPFRPRRSSYGC